MAMYPALRPCVQPSSDSWYGKYYRSGDGYQGRWPGASFGCGWLLSLGWLPSMRKDY